MRYSCVLHKSLATSLVILVTAFLLQLPAVAHEPSCFLPSFACEVRYHFRERFPDAKPGEKKVSAPSFRREGLPLSHVTISDGVAQRTVQGCATHLPFYFMLKITQQNDSDAGALEINVLDCSGRSLPGFPQVMPNPLTKTGDSSRTEFELPAGSALKQKIEKSLLTKNQFVTYVDLVVGMDGDFLDASFPE